MLRILRHSARPRPAIDFGLPDPPAQRLGMNARLPPHTGDLAPALPVPVTDLENHRHRALAQLPLLGNLR